MKTQIHQIKSILCPTDFSKNSDNAIKYAVMLAEKLKSKIILFHAYSHPVDYYDTSLSVAAEIAKQISITTEKKLKKAKTKILAEHKNLTVETLLKEGSASLLICKLAVETNADLIVMGTTGVSAAKSIFVGSTSSSVLKKTPGMMMLIPPKAKFTGLSKIVYATDLTTQNLKRSQQIYPFAKVFKSELIYLYVNVKIFDEINTQKVEKLIKKNVSYRNKSGYFCTDIFVFDGINAFLKRHQADCLVMFTHHHNLLQQLFTPSISKQMSLHTTIPLIVMHENP